MNKKIATLLALLATSASYALPFNVVANGALPTTVLSGGTTTATYTITNLTSFNPPSNLIKYLPPNVSISSSGTTCTPTSSFTLSPGQSCTLKLTISGAVNANDPNPLNHLFVCMSDNISCAGPNFQNSLNVAISSSGIPYVIIGSASESSIDVPISYVTNDGGNTWSNSATPPSPQNAANNITMGVSCNASGLQCTAVGYYNASGNDAPLSYYSTDGGNHWIVSTTFLPAQAGSNQLNAVACDSSTGLNCTTVGTYSGGSFALSGYSTDGGKNWTLSSTLPPQRGINTNSLSSVACDSSGKTCNAVGYSFNGFPSSKIPLSYITTNGGKDWSLSTTLPPAPSGTNALLNSVACGSNGLTCTTVGTFTDTFSQNSPFSYYSTDGGKNWTTSTTQPAKQTGGTSINYVACSSSGLQCVAVGATGSTSSPISFVSTDGGKNWSLSTSQPPLPSSGNGSLFVVICDSTGLNCTTAGTTTASGKSIPISYTSINGGNSWTTSTTAPSAPSVSYTELNLTAIG